MVGTLSRTTYLTYLSNIVDINLENIGKIMSTTYATTEPPILNFTFFGSILNSAFEILIYGTVLFSSTP
jgi:hypothetical protein